MDVSGCEELDVRLSSSLFALHLRLRVEFEGDARILTSRLGQAVKSEASRLSPRQVMIDKSPSVCALRVVFPDHEHENHVVESDCIP